MDGILLVDKPKGKTSHDVVDAVRRDLRERSVGHAGTLEDMLAVLGDRRITVCRELTKVHEEIWRTTVSQALERYRREEPRGEFTLAVEASQPDLETEEPG